MDFQPYFGISYLKKELRALFQLKYLSDDIFAGLAVTCISIPLSLAIAMASGVPPGIGLISAIIGGILAAVLGGTSLAVTGPAAAMTVLIASNVENYGLSGLLIIGIMCGLLQILSGVLRLGHYAKMVPLPVITAFTAGIGFIIFVGQLPKALQLPAPAENHIIDVIIHIGKYLTDMNPISCALAILTIAILKIIPRFFPKFPTPLLAVAVPSLIVYFAKLPEIQLVGTIPHALQIPHLPDFAGINNWPDLIVNAVAVYGLASLETLLSSNAVDNMGIGPKYNPNQELIGQGIANTVVSFFGGLPVTGVIVRSTLNIKAGAKTRRSAIIHSLGILIVIYTVPQIIEQIPIAALAGILLSTALSMMKWREFVHSWQTDRSEALIYLITFIAIIITDLIRGIQTGIAVAFLIVAIRMLKNKPDVPQWINQSVLQIRLTDGITFWSLNRLHKLQEYVLNHSHLKCVIFEFSMLHSLDSSGALHLINTASSIAESGIQVVFHGLQHNNQKILQQNTTTLTTWVETTSEHDIAVLLAKHGTSTHK